MFSIATYRQIAVFFLLLCQLFYSNLLNAREVSENEAMQAVKEIISSFSVFGEQENKISVRNLIRIIDNNRTVAFAADLSPSGFVIISSDTQLYPLIAFPTNPNSIQVNLRQIQCFF